PHHGSLSQSDTFSGQDYSLRHRASESRGIEVKCPGTDKGYSDSPCIMNIQIRTAAPDDAVSIASVLHESFAEYQSLYTPEGFAATTPAPDKIQARMGEGPMWVAL